MSLFVRMMREEWRLHSELFRGAHFAAFPLAIAGLAAGGSWLLFTAGTDQGAVVAGVHGLVAFLGLQVGTIGLVGRDALRDVVGDVTMLVFSARTLPLSWRRLLATFLVKDLLYYSAFVVTPAIVGYGAVALVEGTAPSLVALTWVTVTAAFALGATMSLALAGLGTRSKPAVLLVVAAVAATVVATSVDVVAYTSWALYTDPGLVTAAQSLAPIAVLGVVGVFLFRPVESGGESGSQRIVDRVLSRAGGDWATRRPLLSVARSSGSVWKVVFSMGVLFAVAAVALDRVAATTGLAPAPGIAFGTLLGLGAFTTYSWVTQFADTREHLRYPQATGDVFRGMARAYLVLAVAAGLPYLALATLWYDPLAIAPGLLVLPLVALYVFGVSTYVTGLSPNTLLFDTPLFLQFGVALAALALPLIVASLAVPVAPLAITAGAVALAGGAAAVGLVLARRAGPRWDERLRG